MGQNAKQSRLLENRSRGRRQDAVVGAVERRSALRDFFCSQDFWFAAALLVAVFLVYQPCWQGGFVWDDDLHLLNNPVLKHGGLAKIWAPGGYSSYWPLTYTAYWLEFQLWGLQPLGFHFVNLVLHAVSALLVWQVLVRLRVPWAILAAALFALHPVNVETVAWIAQLKTLLSSTLALVSILLYLDHGQHRSRWRYALALAAFLLSALAKGTALMLPVVLLACAWRQRGRIQRQDLLRVVPYFLSGAIMVGFEVWTQHVVAGTEVVRSDGIFSRAALAGCALWFYLGKLLWPLDLCPFYPRWTIAERSVLSYVPGLLWMALLVWAWRRRDGWGRPVVMLIVCYTALLLPALGFVNIYFMRYSLVADHWQYLAMIVPCAVLADATATLARWYGGRPAILAASVALLSALAVLSWRQSRMYAEEVTYYQTTIDRNPACWLAHNNLGNALAGRGRVDAAIIEYRKALELKPDYAIAHNNLGNALASVGQINAAIAHFQKALEINPDYPEVHINFGNVLAACGHVNAAINHYEKALEIKPNYVEAHNNLGNALAGRGQFAAAAIQYQKALEIEPGLAAVHNNLGLALAGRGNLEAAITQYQKALEINPNYAEAHDNLGLVLAGRQQVDAAIAHYQKALEIKPDYAQAHNNLGVALAGRGQVEAAIAEYRTALKIKPDYAEAHVNLGNALAGRGQIAEAIAHCQKAAEIKPNYAEAYLSLGNIQVGRGQVDAAIAQYQKAVGIKPDFAEAHNNLGVALARRGKVNAAITQFRLALKLKPDYAEAQKNLAAVLAGRGAGR